MQADRAAIPGVVHPGLGWDLDLLGHILHCWLGHLASVFGEAALKLEELEEQAEPQQVGSVLAGKMRQVVLDERPAGDDVLWFPVLPHRAFPRSSKCLRAEATPECREWLEAAL
jgi:hypothetical protein